MDRLAKRSTAIGALVRGWVGLSGRLWHEPTDWHGNEAQDSGLKIALRGRALLCLVKLLRPIDSIFGLRFFKLWSPYRLFGATN
jgi:hypothetical protein